MAAEDDQADLEFSPQSGPFTEDGITVNVMIYKPVSAAGGWTLEVVIDEDNSVVFEFAFDTDVEAHAEFMAIVAENGLADLLDAPEQEPALNS